MAILEQAVRMMQQSATLIQSSSARFADRLHHEIAQRPMLDASSWIDGMDLRFIAEETYRDRPAYRLI